MPTPSIQINLRIDPEVYDQMKAIADKKAMSLREAYNMAFSRFIKSQRVFLAEKLPACNQ